MLVKRLAGRGDGTRAPSARRASPDEADLWSYTVGRGFFEHAELTTEEMDVGRAIFAHARRDVLSRGDARADRWPAAARCAIRDGLATLFADSTVADFRRDGAASRADRGAAE